MSDGIKEQLRGEKQNLLGMYGGDYNTGTGRGETGSDTWNMAYDPYKDNSYTGNMRNRNPYKPLWQQNRVRTTPYEKEYGFSELWND